MKNASKKINEALTIIRKFYTAVNIERTDNEDLVYLFDYNLNKKTVGSDKIAKAVEKAMKQQDFPKDVYYSEGMLTIIKQEEKKEVEYVPEQTEGQTENEAEQAEEITEEPKKRGRKKQIDA
jgi:hypothetical protein